MRRVKTVLILMTVALAAASAIAAQQNNKPLTNADVISMVKSLLPESVIVSAIKSNDTSFDVSASGLIALKKAGVTAKVMEAMLDAANGKKSGANIPAPSASGVPSGAPFTNGGLAPGVAPPVVAGVPMAAASGWQPIVSILQGSAKLNLTGQATEIVQTKAKPTSLASLAADQLMQQALQTGTHMAAQALMKSGPGMALTALNPGAAILGGILSHRPKQTKMTYVWALNGGNSSMNAGINLPTFDVNYAGLPGVNAEQFEPVIVKLSPTPQSNFRLIGATEAATNAEQSTQQDWPVYSSFVEDRIDSKVQKLGSGHAQITPATAVSAGEYAIALRPVDKAHKFSGEEVGKNQGEGLLFNYAWPFSVK